jgi:hypothetical protein
MRDKFLTPVMLAFVAVGMLSGAPPASAQDSDVRIAPLSMTTQVDAGQVVKGELDGSKIEDKVLQRTSVWLIQEMRIRERLDVKVGVGGIFWYTFPDGGPGGDAPYRSLTKFGPGIGRADMTYRFGSLEQPMFTLQAGFFPYKYNPDAKNLGEYLLRSGTYPGIVSTGGWNILSEASYMMQGLRLNMALWDGKFQSEFLLPMERDLPPVGDLSPTYIATVAPVRGLEIGAGAACNHCIAVQPSKASPEVVTSTQPGHPGNAYIIDNPAFDPNLPATDLTGANPRYVRDTTRFYTFQGVKVMARASVDPKAFLPPMEFLGPQDLKVYGELAILGVKNYPFYYEKVSERMPIMMGINLPTFRMLDLFALEVEYHNSPFPNSQYNWQQFGIPTLNFVDSASGARTQDPNLHDWKSAKVTRDDWKWSVYAKKEVIRGMRFYAQVASDHIRLPDYTTVTTSTPVTGRNGKDWYYLVRFELGI